MKRFLAVICLALIVIVAALKMPSLGINKAVDNDIPEASSENEDGMELAMQQEFEMTKDPALGYVPKERMIKAQQRAEEILNTPQILSEAEAINWTERGPNNTGGRTRALFIDAQDITGNTVFAASVGGGIWKCVNFKTSPIWTRVTGLSGNLAFCALAQNPMTPNIMYAGTGEGWFNSDNIRGNGIYKSTDGGNTWNQLSQTDAGITKDFENVQDIVVNANGIVFAACRSSSFCNRGGILRSADGGATWTRVIGSFPSGGTCAEALDFRGADLEIAANGDIYATTGFGSNSTNNTGKIWKSLGSNGLNVGNTGTWVNISPVLVSGATMRRIEIACAPNNTQKLVALIAGSNDAINTIVVSENGGATWTTIPNPLWCDQGINNTDFTRGQAWYDLIAAIDPNNPNTFLIGGVDVMKTTSNGAAFTQLTQWALGCGSLPFVHADIHNIIYYPGSSTEMIIATDGGIFYSNNGGTSFSSKNTGYNVTQFYSVALHPSSGSNYMLAGAQDNGTHKFQSEGINGTIRPLGGDGGMCFINQNNPTIQIGSFTNTNYAVSRNGGGSFNLSISNGDGRFINPGDYDEITDVLFHASDGGVLGFIQNVASGTLTPKQTTLPQLDGRQISAVKVDPNVQKRVWVAVPGGGASSKPALIRVDNATDAVPTVFVTNTSPFTDGSYVSCIDVEKGNSNHLLATCSNYGVVSVFESIDGGVIWKNIEGNLPDMPVRWGIFLPEGTTFSADGTSGIALATEVGVWTTGLTNGANTTWIPNNTGMANVSAYMLKYRAVDRTLAVATHGSGIYTSTLHLITPAGSVQNSEQFITTVYPTITNSDISFKTGNIAGIKQMTLQVVDMQGKVLLQKAVAYQSGSVSIGVMPRGIYFIEFSSDNHQYKHVQKIIKQ